MGPRPKPQLRAAAPTAFALAVGAGVALVGFPPLSNANSMLGLADRPWVVVAMPALLITWATLAAAILLPLGGSPAGTRMLAAGAGMLLVGGFASVLGSDDPARSSILVVLAISAPVLMFVGLVHSRLSPRWLAAGFLLALAVMLVRADAVFLRDWGLPGPAELNAAKYQSVAYDFHYYTLGNPNHTAGFLLLPLCLSLFWAFGSRANRRWVPALAIGAALCGFSLILTYTRAAIAAAIVLVILLVVVLPAARRTRMALFAAIGVLTIGMIATSLDYLTKLLDTDRDASVPERLLSLKDGLITLADHPVSGVGLGQYAADVGYFPAHSSIIQAGAEMGVLGLCGLVVLGVAACAHALRRIAEHGWFDLRSAAALSVAVYALYAAVAAPATAGLFSGYNAVWGLTASLMLALSFMSDPATL